MIDIGEGFSGESVTRVTVPAKGGRPVGRGEVTVRGFRLGAEMRGGVCQVCGGGRVDDGKVDLGLASAKGQLHFA